METLLARQCHLEAKLRSVTKAVPNLQIVKTDAQQLSQMIAHTSNLAENVSAKVRKLDDARVSLKDIVFEPSLNLQGITNTFSSCRAVFRSVSSEFMISWIFNSAVKASN